MKFLKNLFGRTTEEAPAWNVTPAADRPAPRGRRLDAEAEVEQEPREETNPFLTDAFEKFEIAPDPEDVDDPYQSYSWEMDPSSETRKLKKLEVGKKTEKRKGNDFNPYDTGVFKRGWK